MFLKIANISAKNRFGEFAKISFCNKFQLMILSMKGVMNNISNSLVCKLKAKLLFIFEKGNLFIFYQYMCRVGGYKVYIHSTIEALQGSNFQLDLLLNLLVTLVMNSTFHMHHL